MTTAARRVRPRLSDAVTEWGAASAMRLLTTASRRPVVDPGAPVAVTLTSHGDRLRSVHVAIESIAAGTARPRTLTLYLAESDADAAERPALRRLRRRGLTVSIVPDWGSHKKYYPAVSATHPPTLPLVTADDDVVYPRRWLADLLAAHAGDPELVIAHRARRMVFADGAPTPYRAWPEVDTDRPSPHVVPTGVGGVLYPVAVQLALREAGTAFAECCPRTDDIWLHATTVRSGTAARQVRPAAYHPVAIPGLTGGLADANVGEGINDRAIAAAYSGEELAGLAAWTENPASRPTDR